MSDFDLITRIDVAPEVSGRIDENLLCEAVKSALRVSAGAGPAWLLRAGLPLEVSVRITVDAQMQDLNRTYRDVDRPTDVLSFSFVEDDQAARRLIASGSPVQLGEVFLSYEYCERQAEELGHSVPTELAWLTVHGTL